MHMLKKASGSLHRQLLIMLIARERMQWLGSYKSVSLVVLLYL